MTGVQTCGSSDLLAGPPLPTYVRGAPPDLTAPLTRAGVLGGVLGDVIARPEVMIPPYPEHLRVTLRSAVLATPFSVCFRVVTVWGVHGAGRVVCVLRLGVRVRVCMMWMGGWVCTVLSPHSN